MQPTILRSSGSGPARRMVVGPFRRYLMLAFAAVLIAACGVLAVNAVVDPLWYWRGNIVTGENFAFNERFAKLNRFLRTPDRYDCLIFGSSRSTLLNQTRITDYSCANLAFSGGVVSEFVALARYLKTQGFSPKLVIVGVDAFNFWRSMKSRLPDFVKHDQSPPGWISTYLTTDTLRFSQLTLAGKSPFPRAYDANFICKVRENAPSYIPPALNEMVAINRKFKSSRQTLYFELRSVFPDARFVGYVPPVSAWRTVEELSLTGYINQYLEAMKAIAERFDVMYDFSVPSDVTMRPENSYDEDHYRATVNATITDVLQGSSSHFGIDVRGITLVEYSRTYKDAIVEFLHSIQYSSGAPIGTQAASQIQESPLIPRGADNDS